MKLREKIIPWFWTFKLQLLGQAYELCGSGSWVIASLTISQNSNCSINSWDTPIPWAFGPLVYPSDLLTCKIIFANNLDKLLPLLSNGHSSSSLLQEMSLLFFKVFETLALFFYQLRLNLNVYKCVKFPHKNLNLNSCLLYITSTYIYEVTHTKDVWYFFLF